MNLVSRRIYCAFNRLKPVNTDFASSKIEKFLSVGCLTNAQIRCKMKLTNPGVFALREKKPKEYWIDYRDSIGAFGYFLLGIPIVTFALGTWQIYRLKWKLQLIERLKEATKAPPVELPQDLEDLEGMEYHAVHLKGTFLHDKEFLIGPRSLIVDGGGETQQAFGVTNSPGARGFWVITPFKVADRDLTILVNRGWVPKKYKSINKRKELNLDGEVDLVGLVRLNEVRPNFIMKNAPEHDSWHYRDLNAMAQRYGTAPVYLDLVSTNKEHELPIGCQTRIYIRNEHLSYIITWYALSVITSFMWYRVFIQRVPIR